MEVCVWGEEGGGGVRGEGGAKWKNTFQLVLLLAEPPHLLHSSAEA